MKEQLENRYGKKQLQTLVENTMSENWINSNSRNCPHCNAAIEVSNNYIATCNIYNDIFFYFYRNLMDVIK